MQNIEKYKKEVFERLKHCEKLDQSDMDTLFKELGEALYNTTTIPESKLNGSKNKCLDIFKWFCEDYKPNPPVFVKTMKISEFTCDEGLKKFKVPFLIDVYRDNDGYYAKSDVFSFYVKEQTLKKLKGSIQFEFAFINDFYLHCTQTTAEMKRIVGEYKKLL